jgi:predicted pyridoxine 5'-phosphate oxidase superfamily flavin-nucleotide-binding protein
LNKRPIRWRQHRTERVEEQIAEAPTARPNHGIQPIRNAAELQAALGGPSTSSGVNTIRSTLAPIDIDWLAECPLWFIGTAGNLFDVSPRTGLPGAVLILDEKTLILPEGPGNRRGDSYHNLLVNPGIGLIFVIPGREDTLRIAGHATMVRDAPWYDTLVINGLRPPLAIRVDIASVFYHCTASFTRIHLWDPTTWPKYNPPSRRLVAASLKCELIE